jgi:hypothetical protein
MPGTWRNFTSSHVGVLVSRTYDSREAAAQAFCRALLYARDHGFNLGIKPKPLATYVEQTAAADEPPPIEPRMLAHPWLGRTMTHVLRWFNARLSRSLPGHRIEMLGGQLVLQLWPQTPLPPERAGLLFSADDPHGPVGVALQTLLLADHLGRDEQEDQSGWRKSSWRIEWQDTTEWPDRQVCMLLDAADSAVTWLNSHPGIAPAGYQYSIDSDDQLWLLRSGATPPSLSSRCLSPNTIAPVFSSSA